MPVGNKDHANAAVVIIGAGISGMCTAIDLIKRNNCRNFIILEKSAGVGGTWVSDSSLEGYSPGLTVVAARQQVPWMLLRRLVDAVQLQLRSEQWYETDGKIPLGCLR